ncbi:hypothetical protein L6164_027677 [Bauhinia variegata]|uniref:Uncharacterized protein n=1 Tax=Bauhinia variegata TaxID=167791 RepID=A0ACB9LU02_BAUVA|nr:hypothetical protein L6164_027677 [Bauhinia variegata]
MSEVNHQRIKTNGIWMHIAEQGTGPVVLLLHGFPEIWYSWRHQLNFLAHHGYRAIAPDLRGYGDSDSPLNPSSYTLLHFVGDLTGLLDHFNEQQAFVVGVDIGAVIGWHLSLLRPERVKGFVALGVPFFPRSPTVKTVESITQIFGDGVHVAQFQEPGRAEQALARYDCLDVMKKFLLTRTDSLVAPPGMEIIDFLPTPSLLPSWVTEEELMVFADKFQESGFTGPLNYYRAMDLSWGLLAPWDGSKITVPTKFIAGDKDIGFESGGTKDFVQGDLFRSLVTNLEVHIIEGGHHFIHQEKAQQVSDEILSFIRKLSLD